MARLVVLSFLVAGVACAPANPHPVDAPGEKPAFATTERDPRCARPDMGKNGPYRMPLADPVIDPESMALLADFPPGARRTAQAAGLEPLLVSLIQEKQRAGDGLSLPLLAAREELTMRLVAFQTQLAGAAFEVHCTSGQIGDVTDELDHRERTRQATLAITSLIIGGLTGVAAGVWSLAAPDSHGTDYVGIGGASLTAAIGALALYRRDPEVELEHPHNLLAPIWNGSDPDHVYSSFIFRMFVFPDGSEQGSPRNAMVLSWKSQLDDAGVPSREAAERILYGTGGVYSSELVQVREQNFTRLEAALQAVARDLELLDRFIVRKFFGPPIPPIPPAPPPSSAPSTPPPAPASP